MFDVYRTLIMYLNCHVNIFANLQSYKSHPKGWVPIPKELFRFQYFFE